MSAEENTILVTGDFVLDHHIYEGKRHHYSDGRSPGVVVKPQVGGAAIVHDLVTEILLLQKKKKEEAEKFAADEAKKRSEEEAKAKPCAEAAKTSGEKPTEEAVKKLPEPSVEEEAPVWVSKLAADTSAETVAGIESSQHAYAFWRPFAESKKKDKAKDKQVWRCSEQMGFGDSTQRAKKLWPPAKELPQKPRVIVISEGGMGFRQKPEAWNQLDLATAQWIVLKTAAPIANGDLWKELTKEEYRKKLIVLVSAHELRQTTAQISMGVSWDDTVQRMLAELQTDEALKQLMQCRHLLVVFDSEGAVWIDLPDDKASRQVHLVFDPAQIEGDQAHELDGKAFGLLTCLAAATVWQITCNPKDPDFEAAAEGGLAAMRDLRSQGHGLFWETPAGFPSRRLAKRIDTPNARYSRARFPFPDVNQAVNNHANWSILQEAERGEGPAYEMAKLICLRGPVAVRNVPHLEIGKLVAVDRSEVEALRNLNKVIRRYRDEKTTKKPLSLGVFGPPGSGKSFYVKQLVLTFTPPEALLEFNLSQFASSKDLIGALHQVRDKVLQGHLPVAFFDEFDSQGYNWLQYLLAPMQDGSFQEEQITHPIGKCIFIFAGGTSWTFETFGPRYLGPNAPNSDDGMQQFRLAKGPDFKSRIDGYLNVVGPNQRKIYAADAAGAKFTWQKDENDIYFPIRRAFMIRSELKCPEEKKLDIDEGVLHALLRVNGEPDGPNMDGLTHGSRSLEKILQSFQAAGDAPLTRSLLPSDGELSMYTISKEFMRLCNDAPPRVWNSASMSGEELLGTSNQLPETEVAAIAPYVHEYWQEVTPPEKRKPFEENKETNFAAVRRMIRILDLVGLKIVPGPDETAPEEEKEKVANVEAEVSRHIEYHLETLAEAEHDGWMQWHYDQGWRYSKKRDDDKCLHDCLLPYEKLEFEFQNKDRNSVRHFLEFAHKAKRTIVFKDTK